MPARFVVGFAVGAAALVIVSVIQPGTPTSNAHHPNPDVFRFRMDKLHPAGIGPMYYTDCTDDPVTEANWRHGPDSWDYATAGVVDVQAWPINCDGSIDVKLVLAWEYPDNCGSAVACFQPLQGVSHTTDARHFHVTKGYIFYDAVNYQALPSDNFRKYASAHEFGHAMSLAHHTDTYGKCHGLDYVMTVYTDLPPPNPPTYSLPICALAPNVTERCSAFLEYGYAVAPACDADVDNCSDAKEIANQGIKEPDDPQDEFDFPDANLSGGVGLGDVTAIALIFGQIPGNAGWEADTNGNGIRDGEDRDVNLSKRIDQGDHDLVTAAWNRLCP